MVLRDFREGKKIATVKHEPQITKEPFRYKDPDPNKGNSYLVVSVDLDGNRSESKPLNV